MHKSRQRKIQNKSTSKFFFLIIIIFIHYYYHFYGFYVQRKLFTQLFKIFCQFDHWSLFRQLSLCQSVSFLIILLLSICTCSKPYDGSTIFLVTNCKTFLIDVVSGHCEKLRGHCKPYCRVADKASLFFQAFQALSLCEIAFQHIYF